MSELDRIVEARKIKRTKKVIRKAIGRARGRIRYSECVLRINNAHGNQIGKADYVMYLSALHQVL
jgi:hypothetical protein